MARDRDHDAAVGTPAFERASSEPAADHPAGAGTGSGAGTEVETERRDTAIGAGSAESAPPAGVRRPRTLEASALLGDDRVLHIEHGDEVYTLRLTRNDRLILTK